MSELNQQQTPDLIDRLGGGQDAWALVDCPNDRFISNARTLLQPVADSDGVVLRAVHDSDTMPDLWLNASDDELSLVREYDEHTSDEATTGIDAIVAFAHTYGHEQHTFSAEFATAAPEVIR